MTEKHNGLFITLEGIEGAGKSTHMTWIDELLKSTGREVILTREPGGTELGEQVRHLLLQQKSLHIDGVSELLLMFAARAQHLSQVILPAMNQGLCVVCDRFTDSSYAYQGGGRGVPAATIDQLAALVHPDLKPDLTLLFDVPVETGLARAGATGATDRFESETAGFFEAARTVFLEIAAAEPARVRIIDAEQDIATIQAEIKNLFTEMKLC